MSSWAAADEWQPEPQAARQARVSDRTLRRWVAADLLRPVRFEGRNWYNLGDVLDVEAGQRALRRGRVYWRG